MSNIPTGFSEEEEEDDFQRAKYLTFLIQNKYYAFPIRDVKEIIEVQEITAVPEVPNYCKGIINLRGAIIPIVDVRLRFKLSEAEYTERTCIVVVMIGDVLIGFVVDTVDEVVDIDDENISPAPAIRADGSSKYITGVGKIDGKIIMLLDANKLLKEDDIAAMASAC